MLLEVPYINGYNEFLEYFSKEIYIHIPSNFDAYIYKTELSEVEILLDSLSYINTSNLSINFKIKIEKIIEKYYLIIESEQILNNLKLSIQYTYKNTRPKKLYSIDYEKGVIHFSEKTIKNYEITYSYDNVICTGKSATQLLNKDFNSVNKNINIKNFKENSSIFFLYKKEEVSHRNLTPVLQDLKLNYIIKDDISI